MTSEARSLHEADEDGFHEIQLNGKQLVFLGMTTTLVSVVIFLCGVLVGRGVKPIEPVAEAASVSTAPMPTAETATPVEEPPPPVPEAANSAAAATPAAGARSEAVTKAPTPRPASTEIASTEAVSTETRSPKKGSAATVPAATGSAAAGAPARTAPPAPVEELSYYDALQKGSGKPSAVARSTAAAAKSPVTTSTPTPASAPAPAPATAVAASSGTADSGAANSGGTASTPAAVAPALSPAPAAAAPATASTAPASPAMGGAIAVQVAALTSRVDAEAIARRLSGKGYAAYVLSPAVGAKQVFKVRVGNYTSADEAERVSRRLKQEEKLQPWVIR